MTKVTGLFVVTFLISMVLNPAFSTSASTRELTPSPIGDVDSIGEVWINGQAAVGTNRIWSGVQLIAPATGARVSLFSVGDVTLYSGAAVKLSTRLAERRVLIASVLAGEMLVSLGPEVTAYIEAAGESFVAAEGSRFRVGVKRGRPVLETTEGSVRALGQSQQRYVVRPVGLGSTVSVRARSTRQIQVQVTDENDRPVPDLPILFALGGRGVGSLGPGVTQRVTFTATTDSNGMASTTFTAGDNPGTDSISATVEGTRYSWIGQITVTKAGGGFWSAKNTLLVLGAAGGAAAVVTYFAVRDTSEPIRAVPNIRVEP